MKSIIDILLSIVYLVYFGIILLLFHPIQWIAFNAFGSKAHQKVVQTLNAAIVYGFGFTGSVASFANNQKIDPSKKYLIIANHQSMFDISGIIWFLRKLNPIFVSKIELSKGIPSISYNLRHSGAALIDRKDRRQAITAIKQMCVHAEEKNFSPVIFPEGTRSRQGQLKRFSTAGVDVIIRDFKPDFILPVLIRKTGKFNPKGFFPFSSFTRMYFEVMPLMVPSNDTAKDIQMLEESFRNVLSLQ